MAELGPGPVLLKLGGSLITDKGTRESARTEVVARIARELADCRSTWSSSGLVVGHGSGSFGHFAASGTPLAARSGESDREALRSAGTRTQDAAARLHRLVVASLLEAGLEPFSLPPAGWMTSDRGITASLHLEPLVGALALGMTPVVHGDVVIDRALGLAIASTEDVFEALSRALGGRGLRPSLALWLGETDGILDASGRRVPRVGSENLERVRAATAGSAGVDVTGGMRLRLETAWALSAIGTPSWIGDGRRSGALAAALTGSPVGGTWIEVAGQVAPRGEE